ncbi:hypothetical protein GBAR_LOCUS20367, partial [Geodia barretti]
RGRRIYTLCHVSVYIAFLRLPVLGVSSLSLQNSTALTPGFIMLHRLSSLCEFTR